MSAQDTFNDFIDRHYEVCDTKDCDPGNIVDGIINEVMEVI